MQLAIIVGRGGLDATEAVFFVRVAVGVTIAALQVLVTIEDLTVGCSVRASTVYQVQSGHLLHHIFFLIMLSEADLPARVA